MRDLALEKALAALAADAGRVLHALVEAGEEVPYEVSAGDGSMLAQYSPLTERFIVDHAADIRALGAFPEAREAIDTAGIAAGYLEEVGVPVPPGADERNQRALLVFLCRLWQGSTDFSIDSQALRDCLDELSTADEPVRGEVDLVVPIVGLRLPVSRIELAGVEILRSDLIEVPDEARRGERRPNGTWEPTYLASARISAERSAEAEASAPTVLGRVVTTLRLFKTGGVGLGPHAWVRARGDRWRRVTTGAPRPRPGGYVLEDTELGALAEFALSLESRPLPHAAPLERALARFEAGMERTSPLDALNDHLLALRYMLEGAGPARTPLPRRAAALVAVGRSRDEIAAEVEAALRVERELWSGERSSEAPARIAAATEDLVRVIVRRAMLGEFGEDLRAAADEALLGEGLSGTASVAEIDTADWGIDSEPEPVTDEHETDEIVFFGEAAPMDLELAAEASASEQPSDRIGGGDSFVEEEPLAEPRPAPGQISVARMTPLPEPQMLRSNEPEQRIDVLPEPHRASPGSAHAEPAGGTVSGPRELDVPIWLDDGPKAPTLDFPERGPAMRLLDHREQEKAALDDRVAHLFPRPDTDWSTPGEPRLRRG